MEIMRNTSNHCYVIFDHQSVKQQKLSYQHKSIMTAILPTHSNTSNSKIEKNVVVLLFSETWRHLGIAQTNLALLSVCTSFPR